MPPKQVEGRDNGRTARSYGQPVGVECSGCGHRTLVPLDRIGVHDSDMRLLIDHRLKCTWTSNRIAAKPSGDMTIEIIEAPSGWDDRLDRPARASFSERLQIWGLNAVLRSGFSPIRCKRGVW